MPGTVELHHISAGPPDAPTVLFGPSIGTTGQMWRPQLDQLSDEFRVVAFDTRGHGRSPGDGTSATVADLAADVLALADRLGVTSFGYCGLSLGGAIGQHIAATRPDRVDALVLCCTAAKFGESSFWHERAARVRGEGMSWLIDVNRRRWFGGDFLDREPETANLALSWLAHTDPAGYAACSDALAAFDAREMLPSITAPTLVLAGSDDVATPVEWGRELTAGIEGAELSVISGAGHLATLEAPDITTPLIRSHLRRCLRP